MKVPKPGVQKPKVNRPEKIASRELEVSKLEGKWLDEVVMGVGRLETGDQGEIIIVIR